MLMNYYFVVCNIFQMSSLVHQQPSSVWHGTNESVSGWGNGVSHGNLVWFDKLVQVSPFHRC